MQARPPREEAPHPPPPNPQPATPHLPSVPHTKRAVWSRRQSLAIDSASTTGPHIKMRPEILHRLPNSDRSSGAGVAAPSKACHPPPRVWRGQIYVGATARAWLEPLLRADSPTPRLQVTAGVSLSMHQQVSLQVVTQYPRSVQSRVDTQCLRCSRPRARRRCRASRLRLRRWP